MRRIVTQNVLACWFAAVALTLGGMVAHAAELRVSGTVVDTDDQPVAAAVVEVMPYDATYLRRGALLDGADIVPAATDQSSKDGRFAVVVPSAGMWMLRATAKGHVSVYLPLTPLLRDKHLLAIALAPARPLTVRAVDAAGNVVSGAVVMVDQQRDRGSRRLTATRARALTRMARETATTNERGIATVDVATTGNRLVRVGAAGGLVGQTEHRTGTEVEVTIPAGTPRRVRVESATGTPRADALLTLGGVMMPIGRTNAAGEATITWPQAEAVELVVITADDHWGRETLSPPAKSESSADAETGAAESVAAESVAAESVAAEIYTVTVDAPQKVTGAVVSTLNSDPISDALVWEAADPANHVRTDAKGRYQIALFDRDRQSIMADAIGFFGSGDLVTTSAITAGDGPTVSLSPGFDLSGAVVDTTGQPVAEAQLIVRGSGSGGGRGARRGGETVASSSADGRFTLGPVSPDVPLEVEATRRGYAPTREAVAAVAPGAEAPAVRIELRAGQTGFGFVRDRDELPVPNADVSLTPGLPAGVTFLDLYHTAQSRTPLRAVSDAAGAYSFADLGPGSYDLAVKGVGFAPALIRGIEIEKGATETDLGTLILDPGVIVEGLVVDRQDKPVAEADIHVDGSTGLLGGIGGGSAEDLQPLRSGADGRFTIRDLAPGASIGLTIQRKGFATVRLTAVEAPTETPVKVILEPTGEVTGEVVNADGDAVESATVYFLPDERQRVGRFRLGRNQFATDAEGRFTATELPAGDWRVTVRAPGFQEAKPVGVEVHAAEHHALPRIVLERGAVLEGRIVGANGAPIAGASVRPVDDDKQDTMMFMARMRDQTSSDAEGRYRLEGLATGTTAVTVSHAEHRKQTRDVEIRSGTNQRDFQLEAGLSIRGDVMNDRGEPVAGASVTAEGASAGFSTSSFTGKITGADGAFEIQGLDEGTYTVKASHKGYATATTDEPVRVAGDSISGIVLRLGSGTTIVGRVLGLSQDELGQVSVIAHSRAQGMPSVTQVDFEGRFRIENLAPGEWTIMASIGDMRGSVQVQRTITAGDTEIEVDLDLGDTITVRGRVVLASGVSAAAGYSVIASAFEGTSSGYGQTDGQGKFRMDRLKVGRYAVTVTSPTGLTVHKETLDVAADDQLTIALDATGKATGTVVDASDGTPIAGATLSITALDQEAGRFGLGGGDATADANGRFQFEELAAGRYRINARMEDYAVANADIEIAGSEVSGVELRLSASTGLTLEVRTATGQGVGSASIAVLDSADQVVLSGRFTAGENGRVRLKELPAGTWRLLVAGDQSATVEQSVQAPGPPVTVVVPDGGVVTARIPDWTGGSLSGQVRALDPRGRPYRATIYGQFLRAWPIYNRESRIGPLPAGVWRLEATADDGTVFRANVTVTPGAAVTATLQ